MASYVTRFLFDQHFMLKCPKIQNIEEIQKNNIYKPKSLSLPDKSRWTPAYHPWCLQAENNLKGIEIKIKTSGIYIMRSQRDVYRHIKIRSSENVALRTNILKKCKFGFQLVLHCADIYVWPNIWVLRKWNNSWKGQYIIVTQIFFKEKECFHYSQRLSFYFS